MDNIVELDTLTVNYSKIKKSIHKIQNFSYKLANHSNNDNLIAIKKGSEIEKLRIEINKGKKKKKKFELVIIMGALVTPLGEDNCQIIYDLDDFTLSSPNEKISVNNFIVDNHSHAFIGLMDEKNNIYKLRKWFNNLIISMTDNECLFISEDNLSVLERKILHLINGLCNKSLELSIDERIKYGICQEKMETLFNDIDSILGYDLKEYCFAGLNILKFDELVEKTVIKLFNGEILKDFEKIIISKLTDKQILQILNSYIQHNYKGKKLNNYLLNIRFINKIPGYISFQQHVKSPKEENVTCCQDNVIEVDFVKKKIKK